ncbi:MgtC/SapB family protein, partial [Carnobacterium sp.]|uniref:MgtC/SapB family protein n=1 Tax=Carnobacterium sp. TaxID=48221 RepID=UPI0028B20253
IIQKKSIKGLTSAAGIWTTAGIGLTIGGGLYFIGISATILTLIAFELSRFIFKKVSSKTVVFGVSISDKKVLQEAFNIFHKKNRYLQKYQLKEM